MRYKLTSEYVAQLWKLSNAYQKAVARFTETNDLKEMQSAAIEMKAIAAESNALTKELLSLKKPK
jgi:hypothetical protein